MHFKCGRHFFGVVRTYDILPYAMMRLNGLIIFMLFPLAFREKFFHIVGIPNKSKGENNL